MVVPTVLATTASTRARLALSVDALSSLILSYSLASGTIKRLYGLQMTAAAPPSRFPL